MKKKPWHFFLNSGCKWGWYILIFSFCHLLTFSASPQHPLTGKYIVEGEYASNGSYIDFSKQPYKKVWIFYSNGSVMVDRIESASVNQDGAMRQQGQNGEMYKVHMDKVEVFRNSKLVVILRPYGQNSTIKLPDKRICLLLIHGFAGKHTTWNEAIQGLSDQGFRNYGNYDINQVHGVFEINKELNVGTSEFNVDNRIPIFTMDFSDNQNLSFEQQGMQVYLVVREIRSSFGINKIVLIGHSMGGLAARRFIMDYGIENVAGLITISTPHLGSFLGYAKDLLDDVTYHSLDKSKMNSLLAGFYLLSGINYHSKAIDILKPASDDMKKMYTQNYPVSLPTSLIISRWNNNDKNALGPILQYITEKGNLTYAKYRDKVPIDVFTCQLQATFTDGVVTVPSQDLKLAVINGNSLNREMYNYFWTDRFHMDTTKDVSVLKQAIEFILSKR